MTFQPETGRCYGYFSTPVDWDTALMSCQSLHAAAHLMDIQTVEEQTIAQELSGNVSHTTGLSQINIPFVNCTSLCSHFLDYVLKSRIQEAFFQILHCNCPSVLWCSLVLIPVSFHVTLMLT